MVALGERDCSLQRRHQKLVEEAPAPGLTSAQRRHLHGLAVRLGEAASLRNAATCEFLHDPDGNSWFLEVNTRLQVEHGVTELVAGVDIVREQFRIAAGRPLSPEVVAAGERASTPSSHAIEVRIAAEDPARAFAPTPGRVGRWVMPSGPGVRVDTHIEAGERVPADYDNLIAKVMVHAHDRDAAIDRLRRALDETEIGGVQTTLPFHRFVARSEAFRAGDLSTGWVDQHWDGDAAQTEAVRKALLATGLASVTDEPGPAGMVMTTSRGCSARRRSPRAADGAVVGAAREWTDGRADDAWRSPVLRPAIHARSASASMRNPTPVTRAPSASRPCPDPLQMTNPTVGRGPFGGAAMAPQDESPAGVSAQRQFLVDDAPSDARIRSQGGGRYLLEEGSGLTRVVLETASVVAGGIRRREVLVDGFRSRGRRGVRADRRAPGAGEPGSSGQRPCRAAAGEGHHPG